MNTKICSSCKNEKPLSEFYNQSDRKNGYSYCKKCHNTYCMERWKCRKEDAIKYKGGKCVDCGRLFNDENPAYLFDFHHLDPTIKEVDWRKMRQWELSRMRNELDKCVCVCVICHRHREYREKW